MFKDVGWDSENEKVSNVDEKSCVSGSNTHSQVKQGTFTCNTSVILHTEPQKTKNVSSHYMEKTYSTEYSPNNILKCECLAEEA